MTNLTTMFGVFGVGILAAAPLTVSACASESGDENASTGEQTGTAAQAATAATSAVDLGYGQLELSVTLPSNQTSVVLYVLKNGLATVTDEDITYSGVSNPNGTSTYGAPVYGLVAGDKIEYRFVSGSTVYTPGPAATNWARTTYKGYTAVDLGNGQVLLSVRLPLNQNYVEVFARQNGLQNVAQNIATSAISDGYSDTYYFVDTGLKPKDLLEYRFYSYTGPGVFTPGPTEATWAHIVISDGNLLTQGWDAAASTNLLGAVIQPSPSNAITFPLMNVKYCPGNQPEENFVQYVTVPKSGTKFHLSLGITSNTGSIGLVSAGATLNGVAGTNYAPNGSSTFGMLYSGVGAIEADFDTPLAAGQTVALTVDFGVEGVGIPDTSCGVALQNYTLGGALLTRVR